MDQNSIELMLLCHREILKNQLTLLRCMLRAPREHSCGGPVYIPVPIHIETALRIEVNKRMLATDKLCRDMTPETTNPKPGNDGSIQPNEYAKLLDQAINGD